MGVNLEFVRNGFNYKQFSLDQALNGFDRGELEAVVSAKVNGKSDEVGFNIDVLTHPNTSKLVFIVPASEILLAESVVRLSATDYFSKSRKNTVVTMWNNRIETRGGDLGLITSIRDGFSALGCNFSVIKSDFRMSDYQTR